MGLKNLVIKDGGLVATTSGSTVSFVEDGVTVPGGLHLITQDTLSQSGMPNYSITARNRAAVLDQKTGQFGKAKRSISVARPFVLPGVGRIVFNTIRIELEIHPLTELIDQDQLRDYATQVILGTNADDFFRYGSLS